MNLFCRYFLFAHACSTVFIRQLTPHNESMKLLQGRSVNGGNHDGAFKSVKFHASILQFVQLHTDFHKNDSGIPESLILSIH